MKAADVFNCNNSAVFQGVYCILNRISFFGIKKFRTAIITANRLSITSYIIGIIIFFTAIITKRKFMYFSVQCSVLLCLQALLGCIFSGKSHLLYLSCLSAILERTRQLIIHLRLCGWICSVDAVSAQELLFSVLTIRFSIYRIWFRNLFSWVTQHLLRL